MGIENPIHLLFIGIVALLVLGPKRLPELARALGHGLREFREAINPGAEVPVAPPAPQQSTVRELPAPALPPEAEVVPAALEPVAPTPVAAEPVPAAQAGAEPVDPTEPIRSEDAPDSRPL